MTKKHYTPWVKSSYSGGSSSEACVDTRKGLVDGIVEDIDIADSKDPARSTVITVSPAAWTSFVASVRD
jgi:hypothetical protein